MHGTFIYVTPHSTYVTFYSSNPNPNKAHFYSQKQSKHKLRMKKESGISCIHASMYQVNRYK
jgi:hypothetical protein